MGNANRALAGGVLFIFTLSLWFTLSLGVLPGGAPSAYGWAERGHHSIAAMAARAVKMWAPKYMGAKPPKGGEEDAELYEGFAKFMSDRMIALGHLANIPDTSWKDSQNKRRISDMNSPNHYFGPERLLGAPAEMSGEKFAQYLEKIRALTPKYEDIKKQYDGKKPVLEGMPQDKLFSTYSDLGTTPWRAQQLYDLLVAAWKCAKGKEGVAADPKAPVTLPFRLPVDGGLGEKDEPPLPTYACDAKVTRKSDLYAAYVISGILAHFIGDQTQPYHPTADYDGWVTGNGGIHAYFEASVVQALDEALNYDVLATAQDPEFRKTAWESIAPNTAEGVALDLNAPLGVVKLLYGMAIDSLNHKEQVRMADDSFAIVRGKDASGGVALKKSEALPWGDHPRYHKDRKISEAQRVTASHPDVMKGFRPIVVERLATGVVALSRVWFEAWKAGGKPKLSDLNAISLPYPTDPPFIWPDFDLDALAKSKPGFLPDGVAASDALSCKHAGNPVPAVPQVGDGRGDKYRDKYPAEWWKKFSRDGAPDWEVLPQDAGEGEVILSKRTELGIFSNFAATAIEFKGKRYASIEGFWQMMKFPEGKDDPRLKDPKIVWKYTREQVAQMTAFDAKHAGDHAGDNMKKLGITWITFEGKQLEYKGKDQDAHYALIFGITREKVAQHAEVKRLLLATGDLILCPDHKVSEVPTKAYRYYDMYMQIRAEMQRGGE
ncbi:MAG: hypothetical protein AB7F66_00425 [Bacteriovoracia bacterium]